MTRIAVGRLALLAVVVSAAGCAGFTSGVRADEKYDPANVYLYGRFFVDAESSFLALAGTQSMGFAIRCRDGETYTIGFSNKRRLLVIKLRPSICQIDNIVYTTSDGTVVGRKMAPFRLLQNEHLDPGGVYYVGDFSAVASQSSEVGLLSSTQHYSYRVTAITDNYAKSTADLKRLYPKLASVTTEDRMSH